jgi:energy-converting hydrogenase B subunit D
MAAVGCIKKKKEKMIIFQNIILIMIAVFGTAAVFMHSPVRQSIILSFYGMLLSIYFIALKAPEVALSEMVVGAVVIPLMILLALAKVKSYTIENLRNKKQK